MNKNPTSPRGLLLSKISTFSTLPISQEIGSNGHEQQNTNKFSLSCGKSNIITISINNHITTEAQINGNTIFVIKYDFTITDNVTFPANCVLKFDGDSIDLDICCDCFDKLMDKFIPMCKINPITEMD